MNYFELLDKHCQFDYGHCARQDHLSRAHTMQYAYQEMEKRQNPVLIELGTTRSFKHGGHPGCMIFDEKYWEPDKPEEFDWSAGCLTFVFADINGVELHTVDINPNHLWVAKTITTGFPGMHYHLSDSVMFLGQFSGQADLIYMDSGDLCEETAILHKREAEVIIERELVKIGGYILMDDVRNPVPVLEFKEKSRFGKDKYSIGVFLANGFDIVLDHYQMILKRMA